MITYAFVHEIFRLCFALNSEAWGTVKGRLRHALGQCEEQIYEEAVGEREHFKAHHTQKKVENALHQLICELNQSMTNCCQIRWLIIWTLFHLSEKVIMSLFCSILRNLQMKYRFPFCTGGKVTV